MAKAIGEDNPLNVLLVEDSPGDARLTLEAFRNVNPAVRLHVVSDGVEAMAFLRHEAPFEASPVPDLTLLDLNLPRMDGREVLALIKQDPDLKIIPTIILTSSGADADIAHCYQQQANSYLTKPLQLDDFENLVKRVNDFWLISSRRPHMIEVLE
jgi:chemotaxis family two-component system response regulator Rcp1